MAGFTYQHGELFCEGVALSAIARQTGTPVHVYSAAMIGERYRLLDGEFGGYPHHIHYAIKANATTAIVRLLRTLGARADANSGGELAVALRAGFTPDEVVFTGVGKTREELERAVALGVAAINAESSGELDRIDAYARLRNTRARVALRINPDVDAESHPHISTGHQATKFGMSVDAARAMAAEIARRPNLQLVGLHVHVGSQVTKRDPIARSVQAIVTLACELATQGVRLEHLDIGGGVGIAYEPGQTVLSAADYAAAVLPAVRSTGLTLLLEPGRWIVGPAGALVTEIVDIKPRPPDSSFVIVDAGMTDLMRPALYGAWHAIEPVVPRHGTPVHADVVGPVCETTDIFGAGRSLPPVEPGDLLAIRDTGAYGAVMASNYNRRPIAAEVLVQDDGCWRVIRRRQTIDDMLQWDVVGSEVLRFWSAQLIVRESRTAESRGAPPNADRV